jgi:hypothetical protein
VSQTFDQIPETTGEPIESGGSSVGCYVYGCLGVAAFMILLALGSGVGLYYFVSGQVKKYTSTEAADLSTVDYSEEQLAELHERIDSFRQTFEDESTSADGEVVIADAADGTPADNADADGEEKAGDEENVTTPDAEPPASPVRELVLTAEEINALISEEEAFRNRVFIRIEEGEITGEISVPTEKFLPGSKGRFLNASATFEVTLEDGVLIVTMNKADVKGEQIPEAIMQEIRKENLAKDLYKDPKNARMIARFKSITVEDDKIVAKLREK